LIKAESIDTHMHFQQHKKEDPPKNEEIDIDALIARYRNNGDSVDIEATL
jgi:predicted TIM-barrel fold metal-dependent hydrolase